MSRRDAERLDDIKIGEAIKALPAALLDTEPQTAWTDIARMRDRLAHRYFDTEHGFVARAVNQRLQPLEAAVTRLLERIRDVVDASVAECRWHHLSARLEPPRALGRGHQSNAVEVLRRDVLAERLDILRLDLLLSRHAGAGFQRF